MTKSGCSRFLLAISVFLTALIFGPVASAQFGKSLEPNSALEKSSAIRPSDILRRANLDELFIQSLIRNSQDFDASSQLASELEGISKSIKFASHKQAKFDMKSLTVRRLEGIDRQWKFYEGQLADWRIKVRRVAVPIADDTSDLSTLRVEWTATVNEASASPALIGRANDILREIADAEAALASPLADMIALGRLGNDVDANIHGWLRLIKQELAERDFGLLSLDSPPIWRTSEVFRTGQAARADLRGSLALERHFADDFDAANAVRYYFLGVFAAILLPVMIWVSRNVPMRQPMDAETDSVTSSLRRPIWAWLVLLIFVVMLAGFNGPIIRMQLLLLLGWVPILLVLPQPLLMRLGRAPYYGAFFYFISLLASLIFSQFLGYRLALFVISSAMIFVFQRLFKRQGNPQDIWLDRAVDIWCLFSIAALSLSILANIIGNMTLATAMVEGVLDSSYAALAIFAGAIVSLKLLNSAAIGLSSTRFQYLADRMAKFLPALISPVRNLLLVIWSYSLLLSFRLYRPMAEWLAGLAEYKIAMGEFSLSLGSLVIFIVAVWASVMLAKGIRKLLSDTIFPSFSFSHGAGTSIASLIYYACILGGFLIALSLAGFDVSKLTIILGALGVGVGFGLQGSVGNFINGIIMLIERPIRQGDIINFDGTVGVVQQIGMRATTLRSPQGAEITIPNAALLGGKITNWSPFGSPRQIEINISVEARHDQATARRLIVDTAAQVKGIASNPPPTLFFHGYSPGTIDFSLRMWTLRGTDWELARSQYLSALDAAFDEAGLSLAKSRADLKLSLDNPISAGGKASTVD